MFILQIFSVGDRANLIHNAFSLCLVGVKSYATVTFLTEYMEFNENDLIPWKTFTYHMGKIAKILEHRPSFQELRVRSKFYNKIIFILLLKIIYL